MTLDRTVIASFAAALAAMLVLGGIFAILLPTRPDLGPDSRYMGPAPEGATPRRPFWLKNPVGTVLILYLNGSVSEGDPDPCKTSRPGISIPRTATELAGLAVLDKTIAVFAFCTRSKTGGFNQPQGDGVPKVIRRAAELSTLLAHIADQGVPLSQVFVMGQSAGAWAGLLVQRSEDPVFAGLIGFAPAFAGRHARRNAIWQAERDRQAAYIAEAPELDALIYGYLDDPYEPVRDMAWLRQVPGVQYVALDPHRQFGMECKIPSVHGAVFGDCIRLLQRKRILGFLKSRLQASAAPLAYQIPNLIRPPKS